MESLNELERSTPVASEEIKSYGKDASRKNFEVKKTASKELRKIQNRINFLESEISKLEKKMGAIEQKLSAPSESDDVMELTRDYLECKMRNDSFTEEWGELMAKLDN